MELDDFGQRVLELPAGLAGYIEVMGDNQEQANTYPATYDVFGRTYFLRMSADF